jgi:hypothetical protein
MRILRVFLFLFLRQVEKGEEDAYFINEYGGGVLGVADVFPGELVWKSLINSLLWI